MEDQWLSWAKRLHALAANGLFYARDDYQRERYQEISKIALEMLSSLGEIPITRIEALVPEYAQGYATPKVDVRGAVIVEDKILLVRGTDQLWTLPGGFADVGLSPQENVVKEISEEAGIRVNVDHLYAIRHKAKHDYDQDSRDFYKLFFLCKPLGTTIPTAAGIETTDAAYFDPDHLPPLSTDRILSKDIFAAFDFRHSVSRKVVVD